MRISGDCLVEWEKEDVYDGLEEVQMEEEEKNRYRAGADTCVLSGCGIGAGGSEH